MLVGYGGIVPLFFNLIFGFYCFIYVWGLIGFVKIHLFLLGVFLLNPLKYSGFTGYDLNVLAFWFCIGSVRVIQLTLGLSQALKFLSYALANYSS